MSIPGEVKYRELLNKLQANQDWIKNYIQELSVIETIRTLERQIKELGANRGEVKAVVVERLKSRVDEIVKKLEQRSLSVANKLIQGNSMAGRPSSEDFDALIIEKIKVENYLIPAVLSLDTDTNDKRIKRVDTEIQGRVKSIAELRQKLADKKYKLNRYSYKPDGTLNTNEDLYFLYTEQMIELSRGLPGEIEYQFSELEKQLLKAKGIVVNENKNKQ